MMETVCESPEATFALGKRLGSQLSGGEVVLLRGELGAGKTHFTRGILAGADVDPDEVTSPSFALVNLYRAPSFDVYHIDLWRLETGRAAAASVGLEELIEDVRNVIIIEWAEKLATDTFHDRRVISVSITGDGENPRQIAIDEAFFSPTSPSSPASV